MYQSAITVTAMFQVTVFENDASRYKIHIQGQEKMPNGIIGWNMVVYLTQDIKCIYKIGYDIKVTNKIQLKSHRKQNSIFGPTRLEECKTIITLQRFCLFYSVEAWIQTTPYNATIKWESSKLH